MSGNLFTATAANLIKTASYTNVDPVSRTINKKVLKFE